MKVKKIFEGWYLRGNEAAYYPIGCEAMHSFTILISYFEGIFTVRGYPDGASVYRHRSVLEKFPSPVEVLALSVEIGVSLPILEEGFKLLESTIREN